MGLRNILLAILIFLLWRAVKPYVIPALKGEPEPKLPPPKTAARPKPPPEPKPAPERVAGKLPHEVLGVQQDASPSEVQEAYKRLVKEYHPDKAAQLGPDLRALADSRTKEINRAYDLMSKGGSDSIKKPSGA